MSTLYETFNDTFDHLPIKIYKHNLIGKYIWSPLHWHRSIEILITFEGRLCFNVGRDNFVFAEDDWFVINSSELHSSRCIHSTDHFKGISILISLSFIETWLGKGLFLYNPHQPEITTQVKEIARDLYEITDDSPFHDLSLMNNLCKLLLVLGNYCIKPNVTYTIPFYKEQARANEFLEYIEMNYRETLSLDDIAQHFKYSPSYFSRFFKELIGVNYYSYLNFVRLRHAAQQLLEGNITLTECALNNGFPNTKSFITMFRKLYGCTPSKFLNA